MLTIVFKETTNTKELNRELESQNLIPIVDIDFLNDWVDTIKNDEANRKRFEELTGGEPNIENLKTLYPAFTKENHLMVDFYFDRISEEEAIKYGNFIQKHKNCISYIQDGIEFTNRFDLSDDIRNTIIVLNRESNEPEKLPKDVDFREDGDLLVEMHIRNKIGKNVGYETLAEIKDRVNIAKKNEIPTEFDSESCMILLDNAVVRNTMSYVRYKKAIEIAGIIAQLDNTKTIKVEHMAEAIQYSILYCTGGYNNLNTNILNFGYGITIKNSKLKNSDIENAIEYLQSLL